MDTKNTTVYKHNSNFVGQIINDELILVPIKKNVVDMRSIFRFNKTATSVWKQIDGKKSIESIITWYSNNFDLCYRKSNKEIRHFIDKITDYILAQKL